LFQEIACSLLGCSRFHPQIEKRLTPALVDAAHLEASASPARIRGELGDESQFDG
jgi:hypothetical protein